MKRQLTGKSDLTKTCVANSIVELDPQPDNIINTSATTPSPAHHNTLPFTHGPAEGTPLTDLSPPASIRGLSLSSLTPPNPSQTNSGHSQPPQSAPAPSPSPTTRPKRVTFIPGISEYLTYATTLQAPYSPPVATLADDLEATAKATAREILSATSLLSLFAYKQ